jgi:hypothetical protein
MAIARPSADGLGRFDLEPALFHGAGQTLHELLVVVHQKQGLVVPDFPEIPIHLAPFHFFRCWGR